MSESIIDTEIWKDIPEYEGKYQISSLGRVRTLERLSSTGKHLKGKFRKSSYNRKKYLIVGLYKNGKQKTITIHKLVALCFIPNPNNLPQVNHKNGIKTDNGIDNLEWCSNLDNMRHAYRTGLKKGLCGEDNGRAILSQEEVDFIKAEYNSGKTSKEISKTLGLKLDRVRYIINDGGWKSTYVDINKRDDRANWTDSHTKNSLLSKFNTNYKRATIVVAQYDEEGKEIKRYRSINNASIQTGIPRKSIEANIYNRAKQAGGYIWRKIDVDINQYKELI